MNSKAGCKIIAGDPPKSSTVKRAKSLTVFGVEAGEDVDKELVNDVHDLTVVLVDGHLKVQSSELAEMPVSEGVLSPAGHHHNSFIQVVCTC